MRDWNLRLRKSFLISTSVWILPMRDWNRKYLNRFAHFLSCLDLTYEGLKLTSSPFTFRSNFVWILPMRDWNLFSWVVSEPPAMFGSYLWGIETQSSIVIGFITILFGSYLWGIETNVGIRIKKSGYGKFGSYLWGIETPIQVRHFVQDFRVWILPMRDWNTNLWRASRSCSRVWILPMRDWNLYICFCIDPGRACLDLTYEGLKLK